MYFVTQLKILREFYQTKTKFLLYSPYYAVVYNAFALPISAIVRQGNTATCVDVEAVANHFQRRVTFGLFGIWTLDLSHTRHARLLFGHRGEDFSNVKK